MTGLPWFSRDLSNLVHPIMPGRAYGILAGTGVGKTLVDVNLVAHWLDRFSDIRVLMVATEEAPRYIDLLACRAADVSYRDFFYGWLSENEQKNVAEWRAWYQGNEALFVLPTREPTLGEIVGAVQDQCPDVLVVDHMHNLAAEGKTTPDFLGLAMSVLTELASEVGIPLVFFAQVHRPDRSDRLSLYRIPTPTSALGSSKIEQSTDVLLGVSRQLKDDIPKDVFLRLAKGTPRPGESLRNYEEANTSRITVLKHRMDDEASRRSVLLSVQRGYMRDRLALVEATNGQPLQDVNDEPPF